MHVKEEVLSITYKAICNMTREKLGVMKKEEEKKRQKPDVPTSQKFKTASLCVYHRATLMHPASVYISQQQFRCLHTHLYGGIQTSGSKALPRGVIFIVSHVEFFFLLSPPEYL